MSTLRTISGFKSNFIGGSRANLFEITIPSFPSGITWGNDQKDSLSFLCKAAAIPGSSIPSIDVPFRGRALKVGGDRVFAPWTITIVNDEDFRLHTAFMQWMNEINRLENATGRTSPSSYMVDAYVNQLGRGADRGTNTNVSSNATDRTAVRPIRSFKLYSIWPSDVGEIPLSFDSDNTIEEFTVEFQMLWNSIGEDSQNQRDQNGTLIR